MVEETAEKAIGSKVLVETPPIHIDVHVHLESGALHGRRLTALCPSPGGDDPHLRGEAAIKDGGATSGGPWTRPFITAGIAALVVWLAVQMGYRAGSASGPQAAAIAAVPPADPSPGAAQIPPELARDLRQPPRVTPAPGAPVRQGAASSHAAFGLRD